MIRINLLPLSQRRPQIPYLRVSLFFVVVLLAIIGCIYAVEGLSVWSLERDQAAIQAHYEELLPVRQAMEQAGDKQKQIDAKMVLVKELEKSRTTSYNLVPHIATLLTDTIWLNETKVSKDDGRVITLLGETGDYTELATFISRLEADLLFSSVTLKSTEGDTKAGTLKFTLDLKLKESK
jgi:Tfp pilus assembly protein PilN